MARSSQKQPADGLTQSERFIKAAQELGTDDDPERFAERVRKLAKGRNDKTASPAAASKKLLDE